ncbi:unnamed protein product [Ostreobium quekettii]|uniref:Uncharacterized protein n=1 Tax=Ostreobium quekettii TaxID=121088 RepID=A0A8S1JGL2_9CHLO|nr:unnamed protein product [Ostreobium quekettii]
MLPSTTAARFIGRRGAAAGASKGLPFDRLLPVFNPPQGHPRRCPEPCGIPLAAGRMGIAVGRRTLCMGAARSEARATDNLYEVLAGKEVYLASDQRCVEVTSLWGDEERCVLVFGRHMG